MSTRAIERAATFPGAVGDFGPNAAPVFIDSDNEIVYVYNKTLSAFVPIGQSGGATKTASFTAELGGTYLVDAVAGLTMTLPTAAGTGAKIRVYIVSSLTSNSYIFNVAGSDKFYGGVISNDTGDTSAVRVDFDPAAAGSSVHLTLAFANAMGLAGDYLEFTDIAALKWQVSGALVGSIDPVTVWS